MRHEVIDLTNEAIYPELIKLLESKGDDIWGPWRKWSPSFRRLAYIKGIGWGGSNSYITITDVDFLQKYGENTEPESDSKIVGADMICPITKKHCDDECCTIGSECNMSGDEISNTEPEADKERELLEGFRDYLKTRGVWAWTVEIDNFLSSLRKPAFELITADNVKVTDPEQVVWYVKDIVDDLEPKWINWGFAHKLKDECRYPMFTTESAALNHRRHNTPAIKLSDMVYDAESDSYCIGLNAAHNLVNERIK